MAELAQLLIGESGDHAVACATHLPFDIGELLLAGGSEPYAYGAAVLGVGEALNEGVPLQVVDQAGDVAGADVEGLSDLAKRQRALGPEAPQDAQPALAHVVALQPAVHPVAEAVGRQPEGGERLGGGHFVFRDVPPEVLAHPAVVQAACRVSLDKGFVHLWHI